MTAMKGGNADFARAKIRPAYAALILRVYASVRREGQDRKVLTHEKPE
jgi:hypothetical protein